MVALVAIGDRRLGRRGLSQLLGRDLQRRFAHWAEDLFDAVPGDDPDNRGRPT